MSPKSIDPVANNHPVPLSEGDSGAIGSYPNVPPDERIISTDDLGPRNRRDMRSSSTGE
jgi:hypothetical protein